MGNQLNPESSNETMNDLANLDLYFMYHYVIILLEISKSVIGLKKVMDYVIMIITSLSIIFRNSRKIVNLLQLCFSELRSP